MISVEQNTGLYQYRSDLWINPGCIFLFQKIDAQAIEEFYGLTSDISKNSESGYILFYQSRDWNSRGCIPNRLSTQQTGGVTGCVHYVQALVPVGGSLHWSAIQPGLDVLVDPLSPHCNKHLNLEHWPVL